MMKHAAQAQQLECNQEQYKGLMQAGQFNRFPNAQWNVVSTNTANPMATYYNASSIGK